MHEVGMMQHILEIAVERAEQDGAQHINHLYLRVGDATGIADEALNLVFEIAKKGTIAETAQLEIEHIPLRCYCTNCDLEFHPDHELYECPKCHQSRCAVRQGQEFELAYLDVS